MVLKCKCAQPRLPTEELTECEKPEGTLSMEDAVQEVAIYIHRFHNLDLFQQGWYRIKVSVRWENDEVFFPGTPARVVQYEVPCSGADDVLGVWRIDDNDSSFSTPPFRIKYAREDVLLCVMISFNLPLSNFEGPPTSAVVMKFELMYAPVLENRSQLNDHLVACPAAVHEFRIPPKALFGLHCYCPVHFDTFHAVLIDTSVHTCLVKSGVPLPPLKVSSGVLKGEEPGVGKLPAAVETDQAPTSIDFGASRQDRLVKALLASHDILLEELEHLSKGIGEKIDLTNFTAKLHDSKSFGYFLHPSSKYSESSGQEPSSIFDLRDEGSILSSSKDELFHCIGSTILHLWNAFLKFHRENNSKIVQFLHDVWASDRRAEWSIWMVYSKVEMPHHYLSSKVRESSFHNVRGKISSFRKLNIDHAQSAAIRAELHRRSIAQMKFNSRTIQDMHIFGDPSRVPVVIVERVVNALLRTTSGNSYFSSLDQRDTPIGAFNVLSGSRVQENSRILRIVVFVHGFQGHHLDLRLVRNQWLLIDPKAEVLMSEANEDKTSGDFREMGQRLAHEVVSALKKKMDKFSKSARLESIRLSFVGHSIGNIIIRAALAEGIMEPFRRYLHTYLSVSGPHLGYLYSSNVLFNSGLWLLKKLKGTQCIHQLTLTDDQDLQNTFLYKLCKQKTLENFKNIILLSSPQDGYVPYHSARIEFSPSSSWDLSKRGQVFLEMLNNCLDQIRSPGPDQRVFMRCDVNFDTASHGRNLNTMIGRAAHIEFLESDIFARFIMWSFPELFR